MEYVWRYRPEQLVGWVWKRKLNFSNHQLAFGMTGDKP